MGPVETGSEKFGSEGPCRNGHLCFRAGIMTLDSAEIRSRAIETTMAGFDFGKVHVAMTALNLRWKILGTDDQEGVPDLERISEVGRELLGKAWDDEDAPNCEYCHGGLRAARVDGCLTLQFVLEESYFVAAVDGVSPKTQ